MIARYLQQQGITAVVLKYRLPDSDAPGDALPKPQQDALAAIQYVRNHAAEWGLDRRRIGVLGFSAGGHLAGSTAVFGQTADGSRPDFVAMLYPVVTMIPPFLHAGSREKLLGLPPTPERIAKFSLEQRVVAAMPPFFLAHARDDKAVPYQNSEMLAAALRSAGVPAELLLVGTGGHGFALGRDADSSRWKDAFLTWLDELP
ncbi:MAG: alpha/beta hydrolase, partial [Opitutaceae bacterium]